MFYQYVLDRTEASCDQEHLPALILSDTGGPGPDRLHPHREHRAYVPAPAGRRPPAWRSGGCTVIAIPCNTSHYFVDRIQQEIGIPIHLHTHDTTGNQVAALLMAAEAGVDVVDAACAPLAGLTSQPSLDALVAALQGTERDTGLDLRRVQELSNYWADVRLRYESFDHGLKTSTTDIYRYEIPGGQYTNLRPQVESLGLGDRFEEVKEMYKTVNDMLGDPVKVTPSSKMVGDLAIFMVQNDLTPENIVERGKALAFPDSVVSYFKGMMGQPAWGFPEDLQKVVPEGRGTHHLPSRQAAAAGGL